MKLDDVDGDRRVQDRRGGSSGGGGGGGLGGMGKGVKLGVPGIIVMVVVFAITQFSGGGGGGGGGGLGEVLGQLTSGGAGVSQKVPVSENTTYDAQEEFADKVTTLLSDYWKPVFADSKQEFRAPYVAVFDSPTSTGGCGTGTPEAGPFYCPADDTIYIDFGFYKRLEKQLGFSGDFAMAYVLAHEYGHHVQNLLGIDDQVRSEQQGASATEVNALSVKVELQADCFAGLWAKQAEGQGRLESGDFDEAIDAAGAVGDDAIQGEGANRDSFTHGSSAERKQWFRTGFDSGDPARCDTFD